MPRAGDTRQASGPPRVRETRGALPDAPAPPNVRRLGLDDMDDVRRIDAAHSAADEKVDYWRRISDEFLSEPGGRERIALAAEDEGVLTGFLFGEVRAFEFGSEVCGWVFAVGVDPARSRTGIASARLHEASRLFRAAGVTCVRTMVRRNDVPVLSFFRSNGSVGGSFAQLEFDLAPRDPPEEDA